MRRAQLTCFRPGSLPLRRARLPIVSYRSPTRILPKPLPSLQVSCSWAWQLAACFIRGDASAPDRRFPPPVPRRATLPVVPKDLRAENHVDLLAGPKEPSMKRHFSIARLTPALLAVVALAAP